MLSVHYKFYYKVYYHIYYWENFVPPFPELFSPQKENFVTSLEELFSLRERNFVLPPQTDRMSSNRL